MHTIKTLSSLSNFQVQQNCSNSSDLLQSFQQLQLGNDSSTPEQLSTYFNTNCLGHLQLTPEDFPSPPPQEPSPKSLLMEKLDQAYIQIQQRCRNSTALIQDIQTMFEQMKIETTEQLVEYIEQNCDGQTNLTLSDVPLIGCYSAAKKLLGRCLLGMEICPVAKA